MASNGSPLRKMCSPAANGPTCSTRTCSSLSRLLSMPCSRQACENAQVEQNRSASPSSADVDASERGNTGRVMARSVSAGLQGAGDSARLRRGVDIGVETHGDITQEEATLRGNADAAGFGPDEAILDH